jgi:hypothetical protein
MIVMHGPSEPNVILKISPQKRIMRKKIFQD